jgi:uncharacterized damage-inducible protein DinB
MTQTNRTEVPLVGSEQEILLGWLDFHRDTLRWKTEGLTQAQLARTLGPGTLTLGGLLKHMALVEDSWFTRTWAGTPMPEPWASVDWASDPDWEIHSAADDAPEQLHAQLAASVARSRALVDRSSDFDAVVPNPRRRDPRPEFSLRWIVSHMVEEYARHNGHADLIRESVDGLVGD